MKKLFYFFLLIILFSGCYSSYIYNEYAVLLEEKPMFTDIPMKPQDHPIKVFFQGEKFPNEPYIKVDIFESSGSGDTKSLIEDLQFKGQLRGVDAIMILTNETISESDGEYVYNYKKISALGIKYIKNIDYLDECIRRISVIALDEKMNKYDTAAIISTDWRGQLEKLEWGEIAYWNFLFKFSEQHLVYEQKGNWKYNVVQDENGLMKVKRVLEVENNPGVYTKTVDIVRSKEKVYSIKVKDIFHSVFSAKINFTYDDNGVLLKKDIDSKMMGKFRQDFAYRENGTLLRTDIVRLMEDGSEVFFFKAIYETYQQEDLKALLAEEDVR